MQLDLLITEFARTVTSGAIEIYNEFSLQHELGIFLRMELPGRKVQFERNVSHFNLSKASFSIPQTRTSDPQRVRANSRRTFGSWR